MKIFGLVGFLFSFGLLVWSSLKLAELTAKPSEQFWVAILVGYLQLTTLLLSLSVFGIMEWPAFLLLQVVIAGGLVLETDPGLHTPSRISLPKFRNWTRLQTLLMGISVSLVGFSFVTRFFFPLWHRDGLRYIAPRAVYWFQQSSIGPYPTMEYRQIVLAFGTDLIFMWGIMFTRLELVGRLLYWLGFPLAAIGLYTVLSSIELDRTLRLVGLALFVSIPILFRFSTYLQPVFWVTLFALGVGFWVLQAASVKSAVLMGGFTSLAVTAKQPALALTSGCLLVLIIRVVRSEGTQKQILAYALSFFGTAILSGYLLRYAFIYHHFGRFSSQWLQEGTLARHSPYMVYVHTVRVIFLFLEFPIPVDQVREPISAIGDTLLSLLHADQFAFEAAEGREFRYTPPQWPANSYGLLGLLIFWFIGWTSMRIGEIGSGTDEVYAILGDVRTQYGIVASSLFFGPLYVLEWSLAPSSVETYLAPGLVLFIPLLVISLRYLHQNDRLWSIFLTAFLIYLVAFSAFGANRTADEISASGLSPSYIAQASEERCAPSLIDDYVPEDGRVLLLVDRSVITYFAFGDGYHRQVTEVVQEVGPADVRQLHDDHPSAYIYITSHRKQRPDYEGEHNALNSSRSVEFVDSRNENCLGGMNTWLYRFV